MRVWSRWPPRDAPAKISAASRPAETTIETSSRSTGRAYKIGRGLFLLTCALVVAVLIAVTYGVITYAGTAFAAEAPAVPGGETATALKTLGTEHGILGLLLTIALAAIVTLFTLLMKATAAREAALATQEAEHQKELKEREAQHTQDRTEWFAQIQLLQEARVGQLREVLTGLTNSTAMLQNVQAIIAERSQTSAEMTAKMTEVAATLQSLRTSSNEDTASIRKALMALAEEIETTRRAARVP